MRDTLVATATWASVSWRPQTVNAKIFLLSTEVREAALDLKAVRRKIKESSDRGYEWFPAEANARRRMVSLSLEEGGTR
jgi:hypothetical protein